MYIESLKGGHKSKPEVDAILLAMFYHINLQVCYLDESGLQSENFDFATSPYEEKTLVRLYLAADGSFDSIYEKNTIKSAGICQSILFDVFFKRIEVGLII